MDDYKWITQMLTRKCWSICVQISNKETAKGYVPGWNTTIASTSCRMTSESIILTQTIHYTQQLTYYVRMLADKFTNAPSWRHSGDMLLSGKPVLSKTLKLSLHLKYSTKYSVYNLYKHRFIFIFVFFFKTFWLALPPGPVCCYIYFL